MMQDSAPRRHPTRRDDNRRLTRRHEVNGLLRRCDDGHPLGAKNAQVALRSLELRIELGDPVRVEAQRRRRHRAVDVHRQHRDSVGFLEAPQPVEHFFHAADGERRNDQLPATLCGLVDDRRQPLPVIFGLVYNGSAGLCFE